MPDFFTKFRKTNLVVPRCFNLGPPAMLAVFPRAKPVDPGFVGDEFFAATRPRTRLHGVFPEMREKERRTSRKE